MEEQFFEAILIIVSILALTIVIFNNLVGAYTFIISNANFMLPLLIAVLLSSAYIFLTLFSKRKILKF